MKKHLPLLITLALFGVLVFCSPLAAAGARQGLSVCGATLAPSLFPFFVLANLLSELGLPDLLGQTLGSAARRLFRISGCGVQAFFLGISAGYPLGASAAADLRRKGYIHREEAQRLLAFCNNSGPAFILGAVGGVFDSPKAGALLYGTHILAALSAGLVFRGRRAAGAPDTLPPPTPSRSFFEAFPAAVSKALFSTLTVCGYVVLFSALLGTLTFLERQTPLARALAAGFMELGSGVAALRGLEPTPVNLAAAALMLGWGGVSVHFQTLAAVADTDIKCARHLAGRALCALLGGGYTYALALFLFP